jgi:hypothetical protein
LQANVDYDRQQNFLGTGKAADYAGIALYAKYAFDPKVAVAGRFEYFNDHDGLAFFSIGGPAHNHVNEFTATLERKIAGHLISRFEYRHDDSNLDFFKYGSGPTSFVKGQTTLDAGLVFVLEPAQ